MSQDKRLLQKIRHPVFWANAAGIHEYTDDEGTAIEIRQSKYLNKLIDQDHRPIEQLCRAALGFKSFKVAKITI